jgi:DNA-binding NarL/FixJ family response regulator
MNLTRVLIVDDVEQVRWDLRTLLTLSGGLEIVGEAANGLEAIRLAESLRPDVVLMDLEMPVLNGYEATRLIRTLCPSCRIVALTVHGYSEARLKASRSGVDAFIVKGAPVESILQTIVETVPQAKPGAVPDDEQSAGS